jgi:dihydroorotate dehydrogenase electron transfer subunit
MTKVGVNQSGIFLTRVARRRSPCDEHFELALALDEFPPAVPGQFVQVLCQTPDSALGRDPGAAILRRPFSIGGLRRAAKGIELDLLGRVVGPGTAWLDRRSPGDEVSILGPLGRGFTAPRNGESVLLVSGGIGLPPIRWLAESLANTGVSCTSIVGAQRRSLLPVRISQTPAADGAATTCVEEFSQLGIPTAVTTDDGSCGLRGRVTDAIEQFFRTHPARDSLRVYACGPEPMLRAVADLCARQQVTCELAMERVMGCGMGTCQCASYRSTTPLERGLALCPCCTEGPVFDSRRIRWA